MFLTLYTIVVVLLLFGVTIFVHELGHFLVARWCGLTVEVFSIGFGPALWKRKIKGVEYKIGILPLGGYVALPQMDPAGGDQPETSEGTPLPCVPPWKKILVSLAGVICNMILAYFIAQVVYMGGKSYAPQEEGAIIGYVDTNSLAYAEGLRIGDRILTVEGQSVSTWDEFVLGSAFYAEVTLDLQTPGDEIRVITMPTREIMGARRIEGLAPLNYCYVLTVQPGSSAEEAGLESGDRVLNVNGIKLYSREHMTEVVDEFAGQSVPAEIERDGETLEVQVRPRYNEDVKRALIGISFNTLDIRKPMDQIRSHASLIFRFLRALVTPKEAKEAAKGVGGPIAILSIIWISVQTDIILALWFTGLLNVNLAILNLLPIPVLDGGHIVFALLEAIRRKPVSPKFVHVVSNVFAILLIMVFLVLSWRDVSRFSLFGFGSGGDTPAETNAAPAVIEPQD